MEGVVFPQGARLDRWLLQEVSSGLLTLELGGGGTAFPSSTGPHSGWFALECHAFQSVRVISTF